MINKIKSGLLALAAVALFGSQVALAQVNVVANDLIKFADGPGAGNGGAFIITAYDSTGTTVERLLRVLLSREERIHEFWAVLQGRRCFDSGQEWRWWCGCRSGSAGCADGLGCTPNTLRPRVHSARFPAGMQRMPLIAVRAMQQAIWFIEQEITSGPQHPGQRTGECSGQLGLGPMWVASRS
jgi:hypothetical protein